MKSSDWLRSGFFFLSFHFIRHVLFASVILGFFLALPAIPVLFGTSAAHIAVAFKFALLGKILLFSFAGALVPFLISRLGSLFLFPSLEPSVQLLASIGIFALTSVLNILAAIAENPVLVSDYHSLGFLVANGGGTYRAILMLIWITIFGVAAIRKIREPFSSTLRVTRAMTLVIAVCIVLVVDWQVSLFYRRVAPANRDPGVIHEMTIMVPHLNREELEKILNVPALDEWKANLRIIADVAPSSESELAQIVSLLSGMQPWEHGIRKDYLNENEQRTLTQHLNTILTSTQTGRTQILTLGTASPVADVLGGQLAQLCNLNSETTLSIRSVEKLLVAQSQIPEKVVPILFPESRCTQKLAPLSQLALQELLRFGRLFSEKQRVRSLWWIDPATGNTETTDELAQRRITSLQNTFVAIDAHLALLDLRRNTRIQIVGLGRRTNGTLAIISEEPATSLPTHLEMKKDFQPLITSAQAALLLKGISLSNSSIAYVESPKWEHIPSSDSEESRAAFYAKRSLLCGWKSGQNTESATFSLIPSETSIQGATEPITNFQIVAPVKASREECERMAHETFRELLGKDISISNRKPMLALYKTFLSPKSWSVQPKSPSNDTKSNKEPISK